MTTLEKGQIQIHTENIFPIIKKAVYSDHEIFLRELISNGVDAISKRRMASLAGDCDVSEDGAIEISINREKKTISIKDNGIGMSSDEVKKYINQVAFSSAEDFLERYKKDNEEIIGHFGLGFYSSFMVANNVELITKSAIKANQAVKWICDGSPNFTIEYSDLETPGTEVILYLMEEELEYLEPSRIKTLITKYCDFMPVDVKLEGEVINKKNPPWKKSQKELTDQDYIDLYRYLYPFQGDPLIWVHLNTDYPYNLQGILYFPKITGRADWENGEIKLYCNQVFVSDSLKEVVPRYLLPLRGVLDSADIPLNVSRSALQTDRRVRSIGNFVSKKVADKLRSLKSDDPKFYAEIWESVAPFVKIGVMEDEKFAEQIEDIILFSTTYKGSGEENDDIIKTENKYYTTIKGYISRLKNESKKRLIYCTDEVSQSNALSLWQSQGAEVLNAETIIDTQFIPWLETRNEEIHFQRVDSELDEDLKEDIQEISDEKGETKSDSLRNLIKESLNNEKITIEIQSLKGEYAPPAMILLPEQMRRINDMGALMEQKLPGLPDHHVLVINKKHPLVEGLLKLNSGSVLVTSNGDPTINDLSKNIAKHLYDMARLGVGGLQPKELIGFQSQTAAIMGSLIERGL